MNLPEAHEITIDAFLALLEGIEVGGLAFFAEDEVFFGVVLRRSHLILIAFCKIIPRFLTTRSKQQLIIL